MRSRTLFRQATILALLLIATGVGYVLGNRSPASTPGRTASHQLWTCSMHPQIIRDGPGRCPICHMELSPIPAAGNPAAPPSATDILIDPATMQNMGLRTAIVTEGPIQHTVRALGSLEEAQPNIHDINLRVSGWIKQVYINSEGQHLELGSPMFELYSPELNLAIEELIAARKSASPGADSSLFDAAARRLELLGLDKSQIEPLSRLDKSPEAITFRAPISGHVTDKPIVDGMAVKAGDRVLRLVDHTSLWIEARVFERDIPYVKIGSKVTATVASRPRNTYSGEVVFIHPHVDMTTRAATARMEVKNAGLALKPGMYATVQIDTQAEERAVLAPREAVIDSGESQVAIVAAPDGHFEPRPVKTGLNSSDGLIQIVSGLSAGESVVTSGQFLIDSESKLREALNRFEKRAAAIAEPTPAAVTQPLPSLDATVRAYLDIADLMGAEQKLPIAAPMDALIAASSSLHTEAKGTSIEKLVGAIHLTATKMKSQAIDAQRESFKSLSEAMISVVDAAPPSTTVGNPLYVMECPMAPGRWIQRTEHLANPYYATDMKECGSHVKVIKTGGPAK